MLLGPQTEVVTTVEMSVSPKVCIASRTIPFGENSVGITTWGPLRPKICDELDVTRMTRNTRDHGPDVAFMVNLSGLQSNNMR